MIAIKYLLLASTKEYSSDLKNATISTNKMTIPLAKNIYERAVKNGFALFFLDLFINS